MTGYHARETWERASVLVNKEREMGQSRRYRTIAAQADASFGEGVHLVRRHLVMVDGRYLVVLDEVEASRPVTTTWMAHTAGEVVIDGCQCRILGKRTNLGVTFVAPTVEVTTLAPPPCVMGPQTTSALHATTGAATRTELATVIWPASGDTGMPTCHWDAHGLEIERPDGSRDCLQFGPREGVFGFVDLSAPRRE